MTRSSLAEWVALARAALTLKAEPFHLFTAGRASLKRAVLLVIVVGLLIGAVQALAGLGALFRPTVITAEEITGGFNQFFEQMTPFLDSADPAMREFMNIYRGSIETFAPTLEEISKLPAPLPGFFGRLFTWLGGWLSTPFALLSKWLLLSIWIMLFARLLGGRGSLLAYLSASSLSTLPHLLGAFSFIPCVGFLLGLTASIWGLAMQARAVELTHDLSRGRAVAAVLLPYALLLLLLMCGLFSFILLLATAGS
ncbi:MAG: YIP1 family protein [Caldilineales bacterium]|nr:YIP1 family protein [Caldilineales bacterium]